MTTREWKLELARSPTHRLLGAALRSASLSLARFARALTRPSHSPNGAPPVLEFYAEAGAPEGALYVDGRLVGHLPGVTRL